MITVDEFLDRVTASINTKKNYGGILSRFFHFLDVKPEDYFTPGRDYEGDVENYVMNLIQKGRAPISISSEMGAISSYLQRNRINIPKSVFRDIRKKIGKPRPVTMDKTPSVEELRKILSHMDTRGRAFFLTMVSSGMRIGEVIKIKMNDIDFDSDPVRVNVRFGITKTRSRRTAFISSEAKEAIMAWLKDRDRYIRIASGLVIRYKRPGLVSSEYLFPFGDHSARDMWNKALRKAGLEERDGDTDRRTLHPHSLRHFFRRKAGSVVNRDIAEGLVGHEEGISAVYANYQRADAIDEMAKQYKEKVEPVISIFSDAGAINALKNQVIEQEKKVGYVVGKNMELEKEVHKNKELQDRIDVLAKNFEMVNIALSNIMATPEFQQMLRREKHNGIVAKIEKW
ncbi:MAG: tyrosine-type recombinase/integrase [Candidatus Hodarchaeota archaeon]